MTDALLDLPEILHAAAHIFATELEAHSAFLEQFCSELDAANDTASRALMKKQAPLLAEKFHLIRGASGFLNLTALRDLATEKEKRYRALDSDTVEKSEVLSELRAALEVLRNHEVLLSHLPRPTED